VKRPLLALALLAACSSTDPAPSSVDTGLTDGATDDAAPKPPIDPKLFDCTAPKLPARKASATPEACLRDPKCKTRLVSGHRGAGGDLGRIAPEDTLAAYRAAIVMGLDLVETDPRPTKDGILVNLHDPTVDRTTNGKGNAADMTFAELRALTLKTGELQGDFSCEKIPTLVELLTLCKGRAMVLIDANKTDRVDLLVAAIKEAGALDWAVFDTSGLDKIDQALLLEPKLMIMPRIEDAASAPAILARYKDHLPVLVEIDAKLFPTTVDLVHAAGTRTFTDVFTTDVGVKLGSPASQYLLTYDKGADVVQTDLPDLVIGALGRAP